MRRLHIFNCDHDYALAQGGRYYTPPRSVVSLRRQLCLTPALYAHRGDSILLPPGISKNEAGELAYHDILLQKGIECVVYGEDLHDYYPMPWGWNMSVHQMLMDRGVNPRNMPNEELLAAWRMLSHRRTTINLLKAMDYTYEMPQELQDIHKVRQWCIDNEGGFLKAPWSSSGRGIYRALHGWRDDIECWCRGVLKKQKSIMAEVDCRRKLDFATEWSVAEGKAVFLGYSVFHTDEHSQYKGNLQGSQAELEHIIITSSQGLWNDTMLDKQRLTIESVLASSYHGPVGIDCLVGEYPELMINPCVEINLRTTMGMVELWKNKL